jgi:hypothetical protein
VVTALSSPPAPPHTFQETVTHLCRVFEQILSHTEIPARNDLDGWLRLKSANANNMLVALGNNKLRDPSEQVPCSLTSQGRGVAHHMT